MHLGVNLRKAFVSGMASDNETEGTGDRKYYKVAKLIHEFGKGQSRRQRGVSEVRREVR